MPISLSTVLVLNLCLFMQKHMKTVTFRIYFAGVNLRVLMCTKDLKLLSGHLPVVKSITAISLAPALTVCVSEFVCISECTSVQFCNAFAFF